MSTKKISSPHICPKTSVNNSDKGWEIYQRNYDKSRHANRLDEKNQKTRLNKQKKHFQMNKNVPQPKF